MGGGSSVKQTNPAQAAASNAAAMGAAAQAQNQGNIFSGQQQQLYNTLFGAPGSTGGGAITGFLNPNSLNVTKPTGVYALQNTNANQTAAKQYASNAGNITSSLAQSGFNPATTPSGFGAELQAENSRALADTKGQNFLTSTTNQYQDALKNFWNAANITGQGAATTGSQANQATGTAANTYQNLYGTAGHGNVTQNSNLLGTAIGAAGNVGAGAAMCCAEGTLIRTGLEEFTTIEELFEGAEIFGLPENDDDPLVIRRPLAFAMKPCVRVKTDGGQELVCSTDHTLLLAGRGYVTASESLHSSICTRTGSVQVIEVQEVGERRVVHLHLEAPHVFESNGLLSEE